MPETVCKLGDFSKHPLLPFVRGGLVRTSARIHKEDMRRQLGFESLIVLTASCRFAKLILIRCHEEDHRRSDQDALWRSRTLGYWIVGGRRVSSSIAKNCSLCRYKSTKTEGQRMATLPKEKWMVPCRPFTHITLDYMGPMVVVDTVKKRTEMKVFPLVLVCLNTGAVHCQLAKDASTDAFLCQFEMFVGLRGCPKFCYSDLGHQITRAGRAVEGADFDVTRVKEHMARQGMSWRHAPSHSQWRDGASEACVKMLKASLSHMTKPGRLTYDELLSLLTKAANRVNQRPLGVMHHQGSTPGYCPVTPNLLLMGSRTSKDELEVDQETPDRYIRRFKFINDCFDSWWKQWYSQVFPSLVPVKKWRQKERNLCVGDIVMVRFGSSFAHDKFRMGRVVKADADRDGLVRTVSVAMRPRDQREKVLPYINKDLWVSAVSAQRVVVICPKEGLAEADTLQGETTGSQHRCDDADLLEHGYDTVNPIP